MIAINKRPIVDMKQGDTFIYNGKLYLVIENLGKRSYLNLEDARIETGLQEYNSVPKVDCTLSYEIL